FQAPEQKSISYAELIRQKPEIGWFKVTGADWQLGNALVGKGKITGITKKDLFVPVTPLGAVEQEPTRLIVHVEDQELANFAASFNELPEEALEKSIETSREILLAPHVIEGTVEFGINSDDHYRKALRETMGSKLADDFIVIRQNSKPKGIGFSIMM